MFLAVAEACSRPLRAICSDNWVSPLPLIIFRNPVILSSWVQRQRSPSAHLVRRRGGTPCWLRFSSAVPGFALQIVSAWFVTFVIQWWRVHCARGCQYIPCQRQRSGDAPLVARTQQRLVLHFVYLIASRDAITRELLSYQEEVLS